MSLVNTVLRTFFGLLLLPFRGLPPLVGLAFVSLLSAVGALLVFKAASNQQRIADVKRLIHACLFEIRLYNDDMRAIFRAQGELLHNNLRYLGLSLVPMLFMLVPFALTFFHLEPYFGFRPFRSGETALLRVYVSGDGARPDLALEVPEGVAIVTGPAWFPAAGEVDWKLRFQGAGERTLRLRSGERTIDKRIRIEGGVEAVSPRRPAARFTDQLLHPAEPPVPRDPVVRAIEIGCPERSFHLFGWSMPWWVVWLALMLIFAFGLRNRMGVAI